MKIESGLGTVWQCVSIRVLSVRARITKTMGTPKRKNSMSCTQKNFLPSARPLIVTFQQKTTFSHRRLADPQRVFLQAR